jgi:hypothetical protein
VLASTIEGGHSSIAAANRTPAARQRSRIHPQLLRRKLALWPRRVGRCGHLGYSTTRGAGLSSLRSLLSRVYQQVRWRGSVHLALESNPLRDFSSKNRRGFERVGRGGDEGVGGSKTLTNGGGGIRTREGFRPPVFKTGALNRSATPPGRVGARGGKDDRVGGGLQAWGEWVVTVGRISGGRGGGR